jgi:ADP-ribose pyrophosphatase
MSWEILRSPKKVWANDWINVQEVGVRLPTGVEAKFYYLGASDGVAVLAVDDQGYAILNRQYRPAVKADILELPAGQLEGDEDPAERARQEVVEESGLHIKDLRLLGRFYRNPARDSGLMHVYFARAAAVTSPRQEKYEFLETVRIPLKELFAWVLSNEIYDVTTIFATLMLKARLENGDIQL